MGSSIELDNAYKNEYWYLYKFHRYNDNLYFYNDSRRYCVDLRTGKFIYRKENQNIQISVSAYNKNLELLNYVDKNDNYLNALEGTSKIGIIDLNSEELIDSIMHPDFLEIVEDGINIEHAGFGGQPVLKEENDSLIVYLTYYKRYDDGSKKVNFGKYNISSRKWVFKNIVINEANCWSCITYKNNVILTSGPDVYSMNLNTGQINWKRTFQYFISPKLVVFENILVLQYDDVHGIDMNTGRDIWRLSESYAGGGSRKSKSFVFNEVIYYNCVEGLIALNPKTGHLYWKYDMPKGQLALDETYLNLIPDADGKSGKIIAISYNKAMAFETVKFE